MSANFPNLEFWRERRKARPCFTIIHQDGRIGLISPHGATPDEIESAFARMYARLVHSSISPHGATPDEIKAAFVRVYARLVHSSPKAGELGHCPER